ncbi:hypothetical protein POM88_050358 [Heracleum sosnowskyi]|uniref:Amino acid transporter transmembrane domain-containing protein n=1 Tax=Heracleum sosnowskyi TaxID=360622 RepID=A0AAD8GZW5_9APIA|nr:hypothetical protein POM88_050358 [Heracleum sosnowskyi]
MGWALGFFSLIVMGVVTFYAYYLMSLVLDYGENSGRRHIRFHELVADVLVGSYLSCNQIVSVGCILLARNCLQFQLNIVSFISTFYIRAVVANLPFCYSQHSQYTL